MSTPGFIDLFNRLKIPAQQWKRARWQLLCDLRVAAPGVITDFDVDKQTVSVQLAVQEMLTIGLVPTPVDVPILQDIPIIMPSAGGFSLLLPVEQGDECIVLFADSCIDSWWQSGGTGNVPMERRRHDLSDGIAILGCWSQPSVFTDYPTASAQLRSDDGKRMVGIAAGAINIQTTDSTPVNVFASTVKLGDSGATKHLVYLEDLITLFNNHIHNDPQGGVTTPPTTTLTSGNGTSKTVAD